MAKRHNPSGKTIPWHPIRGYATEEQWEKLKNLPACEEREHIWRDVEKQTKNKGVIK